MVGYLDVGPQVGPGEKDTARVAVRGEVALEEDWTVVREERVPSGHLEPLVLDQGVSLQAALDGVLDPWELLADHARLWRKLREVC